jgi:hypothetical protein
MPMPMDSPRTWPMIRRLRQPSALSVPNSRTRRATADMLSRLASRKAAARTAAASHLPRLRARLEALLHASQRLRACQRDVHVGRAAALRLADDPDHREGGPPTLIFEPVVSLSWVA